MLLCHNTPYPVPQIIASSSHAEIYDLGTIYPLSISSTKGFMGVRNYVPRFI